MFLRCLSTHQKNNRSIIRIFFRTFFFFYYFTYFPFRLFDSSSLPSFFFSFLFFLVFALRIMFGLRHKLKFSLFKFVFRLSFMDPFSGVHLFHFVVILLCNFDSILHVVLAPFSLFNSIPILAIPPHVFLTSSNDQTTPQNNVTVSNCTSTR